MYVYECIYCAYLIETLSPGYEARPVFGMLRFNCKGDGAKNMRLDR